jgi:hypothetical protein
MRKDTVSSYLDRKIHQSLTDGFSVMSIQDDLKNRTKNMIAGVCSKISPVEFEEKLNSDLDQLQSGHIKYTAYYVNHARVRVKDLDWITKNKGKFPNLSYSQVFKLIQLRDRLK